MQQNNSERILSIFEDEGVLFLKSQDNIELSKGRKAEPLGMKKEWGGKGYIKTVNGWKPVGKESGAAKAAHDYVHGDNKKEVKDSKLFNEIKTLGVGDTYGDDKDVFDIVSNNGVEITVKDSKGNLINITSEEKESKIKQLSELPSDLIEQVNAGKVTYRGTGTSGESKIKVSGKEYVISSVIFDAIGGLSKIRFSAPARKG